MAAGLRLRILSERGSRAGRAGMDRSCGSRKARSSGQLISARASRTSSERIVQLWGSACRRGRTGTPYSHPVSTPWRLRAISDDLVLNAPTWDSAELMCSCSEDDVRSDLTLSGVKFTFMDDP